MGPTTRTMLSESLAAIEAEIAAGQAEQALAHCQEIQTRYPRALAVQRVLGEVWLALRKPREALGALDRALAGNPEDVRACCARAIIHQMHGDATAALSWYRRACDVRPNDQELRATYLEMASQIGQPAYRPSRVGLARLYLRGGLATHALREWELLLAERPDLLDAQVGMIETLWRTGRFAQAEEWSRRTLVNTPSCVKALLIGAVIAHDAGRAEDADRLMQRVTQLDPDQRIAQALFADRLATGDRALRVLLWGANAPEPPPFTPPSPSAPYTSAPFGPTFASSAASSASASSAAQSPGAASSASRGAPSSPYVSSTSQPLADPRQNEGRGERVIRPLVDSHRSNPSLTQSPTPSSAMLTANTSTAGRGAQGEPVGFAQPATSSASNLAPLPRPTALPPTFRSIFKETEGMIWSADDTDSFEASRAAPKAPGAEAPAATQPDTAPGDTFARSTQFVPPMIAEHSAEMDDTEAHRAINWVHWLQAQGARTLDPNASSGETPSAQAPASPGGRGAQETPTSPSSPTSASVPRPAQQSTPQQPTQQPTQPTLAPTPQKPRPRKTSAPRPLWEADTPPRGTPAQPRVTARPAAGAFAASTTTPRTQTVGPAPQTPQTPQQPAASASSTANLQASPETLRHMFAQLELGAGVREIVDADVVAADSVSASSDGMRNDRRGDEDDGFAASQAERTDSAPWPAQSAWSTEDGVVDAVASAPPGPSASRSREPVPVVAGTPFVASSAQISISPTPTHSPAPGAMPETEPPSVLTLEALERGFAASGYQQVALAPGTLAALVGQGESGRQSDQPVETAPPAEETPLSLIADPSVHNGASRAEAAQNAGGAAANEGVVHAEASASAPPQEAMPEPLAEPEATLLPKGPDPKDYAARLELARSKRSAGALDEAFVEYNAVLRNAPDLLDEVMRDLQSLDEDEAQHPEAHRLLGDARIRQGDYMSALESLNRATALSQAQEDQA